MTATDNNTEDAVTIFCVMRPRGGMAAELRSGLTALVEPTRTEAGCLTYDVYEAADDTLILFETWRSPAELETHQQQPAVREFFDQALPGLLDSEMGVHFATLLSAATAGTN